MSEILVDADGCPVKQEVYRVAKSYGLKVTAVSNSQMHIPSEDWLELGHVPSSGVIGRYPHL